MTFGINSNGQEKLYDINKDGMNDIRFSKDKNDGIKTSSLFLKSLDGDTSLSFKATENKQDKDAFSYSGMGLDIKSSAKSDKVKSQSITNKSNDKQKQSANVMEALMSGKDIKKLAKDLEKMSVDEYNNFFAGFITE